jgi:hypothetical protein
MIPLQRTQLEQQCKTSQGAGDITQVAGGGGGGLGEESGEDGETSDGFLNIDE